MFHVRWLALSYAIAAALAAAILQALPASTRDELVLSVSTDPDRLLQHPVRSLLLSPFVIPTWVGLWLLPAVVLSVDALHRRLGSRLAILTGLLGHAAVSVAVAVLLERDDDAPNTAAAADVGVSYVLAVTAGTALATVPTRPAAAVALAGTAITGGLLALGRTSTDAGHLLAWLLGLLASAWLRTRRRRTHTRDLSSASVQPVSACAQHQLSNLHLVRATNCRGYPPGADHDPVQHSDRERGPPGGAGPSSDDAEHAQQGP